MASSYTIKPRQNPFDVALIVAGNAEAVFDIAMHNGISITDDLPVGTELYYTDVISSVVSHYKVNGVVPATAIDSIDLASTITGEGIEFWTIELDFIAS